MANHLTPHDRVFRNLMAKPKVIKEFFENYLPAPIKKQVNLDSIELQKDSYIDDKLRMQITDLLYTAQFGKRKGYLYILIEHQSTPDRLMAFRILKYQVAIMDKHINTAGNDQLPVIYPLVLYNGKQPYRYSTDIFELFGKQQKLAKNIFCKPYKLLDLHKISDKELKEQLWFGVMARMMKHIYAKDILPHLKAIINELRKIEKSGELDYIYTLISYLMEAGELKNQNDFIDTIKTGLTVKEEKLMTMAETFRAEGRAEGMTMAETFRAEGRFEGRTEGVEIGMEKVATNLLKEGNMDAAHISRLTDLPETRIHELETNVVK